MATRCRGIWYIHTPDCYWSEIEPKWLPSTCILHRVKAATHGSPNMQASESVHIHFGDKQREAMKLDVRPWSSHPLPSPTWGHSTREVYITAAATLEFPILEHLQFTHPSISSTPHPSSCLHLTLKAAYRAARPSRGTTTRTPSRTSVAPTQASTTA